MFRVLNPPCPSFLAAASWFVSPSSAPQPWPCLQSLQTALVYWEEGDTDTLTMDACIQGILYLPFAVFYTNLLLAIDCD